MYLVCVCTGDDLMMVIVMVMVGLQVMTEVPQDEVELNLLKTGLGSVTQSDVEAAALAEASIFAFNVGGVPADVKVGRHAYSSAT